MSHLLTIQTRDHPRWRFRWACSCFQTSQCWNATEGIARGAHRKHVAAALHTKLASGQQIDEHW